ncbi:kinase-like domain-containing protein [Sordaria sp. MPI-SDFR-AT-0083]|nr:kinase-like domain-containing protein [Sordaria sp. MPI-SDFR-AT-0083]
MCAARSESPAKIQVEIITADETVKGNIEDPKYYSSGRFFPVQINTEIGSKKADQILRVINKLGHGTYSTVWLVEDTKPPANAPSRWKAIKMHSRGTADNDLRVLKEFKRAGITPEKALSIRSPFHVGLVGQPGLQAPRATVIDMGAAWHHSWDLVHKTLIPVSYKAPECIIHQYGCTSMESDIWALGCSMVKIYMGRTAFRDNTWNSVLRRPDTDVLAEMEFFLGPIPAPYRNAWKQLHKGKNTVFPSNPAHVGFLRYKELRDWRKEHRRDGAWSPLHLEVMGSGLPKEKADMFLDLLESIFKWFPEQRMTLEEILRHPFLQVSGAGPEQVSR